MSSKLNTSMSTHRFVDEVNQEVSALTRKNRGLISFLRPRDGQYILGHLKPHLMLVWLLTGLSVVQTALTGLKAIITLAFINILLTGKGESAEVFSFSGLELDLSFLQINNSDYGGMITVFGYLVAVMIATAIVDFVQHLSALTLQQKFAQAIRTDLTKKFIGFDLSYYNETKTGEIAYLHGQVDGISRLFYVTTTAINSALKLLVVLAILFKMSAPLTLGLLFVGSVFYFVSNKLNRHSITLSQRTQKASHALSEQFFELLHGIRLIKQGSREKEISTAYLNQAWEALRHGRKQAAYSSMVGRIVEVGGGISLIAVTAAVAMLTKHSLLDDLGFTVGFFFIASQALTNVKGLLAARNTQVSILPQVMIVTKFLDIEDHSVEESFFNKAGKFDSIARELSVQNLSFAHIKGQDILKDISLTFKKGEITAIIGLSGSGKTTLLELLAGVQVPDKGSILIDGRPYQEFDLFSLRRKIGYVPQDSLLFHSTIEENLRFLNPSASHEELELAIHIAQLDEFVKNAPEGLKTIVGERGSKISGGQRQRLAIARAILQNPEVFIFDESTSAMDLQTEAEIYKHIAQSKKDRVIIISAHRLSAITSVDQIVVLNDGHIIEKGTHAELMAHGGAYCSLYMIQELENQAQEKDSDK